jgi:PAS domain S-box-containing protein
MGIKPLKLFDIFSVPVWRSGPDAKCDYFNRAWLDFTGRTLEQEIGDGWTRGIHPDDFDACLGTYLRAFAASESFVLEYRLRRHDGEYRWVVDHGAPFSDEIGKFQGYIGACYDITERREVEDSLRRSERRFGAFMDNLPAFAWMKDLEGRYLYTNKRLEELEPYRGAGAIGKTDAELWPAEIASTYQANDREVIATKKPLHVVEPCLAGKDLRSVLVSKFPILDPDGSVVMIGCASVETTAQVQAEEALRAQVLRFQTLMETSMDSIYVIDTNGNLQEANAEFLRRRGYSAAEVKGLNVADWDARWTREELLERARKLIGSNAVFETQHRCKDGSVFDAEVGITSVRIADKQLFFCVTRDITERKKAERALRQSEERFRSYFELGLIGMAITSPARGCVEVNDEICRILGYERSELLRMTWAELTHPDDLAADVADFNRVLAGEVDGYSMEKRFMRKDGQAIDATISVKCLRRMDGSVDYFVALLQDITERKHAHEELRIVSRRLFQVQEDERRHLARELHDEIGQTLTAAKINLESIGSIEGSAQSLRLKETSALLDNLLRQVRQISLDLHSSLLDDLGLAPALRSLLDQQARRARLRTQFCAAEPLENIDPEIQTTCFRIAQEAITNVLRHAKAQSVNVYLKTECGRLQIRIVDDGTGFDLTEIEGRAQEEASFGLMGMRERAVLVGGRVQIISSPNKGTTVEVSLPLHASGERPRDTPP